MRLPTAKAVSSQPGDSKKTPSDPVASCCRSFWRWQRAAAGKTPLAALLDCVECHRSVTPSIVTDWELSRHSERGVDCSLCHGDEHHSADDVALVKTATPDVCGTCHPIQTEQFEGGKHALAWASMNAMPTTHWLPMALTEGMKGLRRMPPPRAQE